MRVNKYQLGGPYSEFNKPYQLKGTSMAQFNPTIPTQSWFGNTMGTGLDASMPQISMTTSLQDVKSNLAAGLGGIPQNPNVGAIEGGFLKNIGAGVKNIGGSLAGMLGGGQNNVATGEANTGGLNQSAIGARNQIRGAVSKSGPVGAIIGAASGAMDFIGDTLGLGLDSVDKNAAKKAGAGFGAGVTNALAALPGVGSVMGWMAGGDTIDSEKMAEFSEVQDGLSGFGNDLDTAGQLGGKSVFGRKKINKYIAEQNRKNAIVADDYDINKLAKANTGDQFANQNQNVYSGDTPYTRYAAKNGMKLPTVEWTREVIRKNQKNINIFALGGKMNVIVSGARHSRRHRLENDNDIMKDVTTKGIPVVSFDNGGEVLQHAEVEGGELVLTKEITDKIESLYKEGSEEAQIEAGKILAEEIIENTEDNTEELLDETDD